MIAGQLREFVWNADELLSLVSRFLSSRCERCASDPDRRQIEQLAACKRLVLTRALHWIPLNFSSAAP